ncbi:MAG: hypothetical protein M5U26_03670 [Planctomycetota bacterium]|nr:hypothetical protein [Planctomycetota bacterium]
MRSRIAIGCAWLLFAFAGPLAAGEETPWEKFSGEDARFAKVDQILTPGLFDADLQRVVILPPDGTKVDLGLPHDGVGKDGKPRPALFATYRVAGRQAALWVDLDGDGQQEPSEFAPVAEGQELGPFVYQASYEDGTSGPYLFKLQHLGEAGKFRLTRCQAKQFKVKGQVLLLCDDNGNGRYDDLGKDALLIQDQPVTLLSRQIYLGEQLHELLVHPAGQTIEVRPLANLEFGEVDLLHLFKSPQKSENLRFLTLIVQGKDGAFPFDGRLRTRKLPVGAYDLVFGLLERSNELVMLKRGERTSFVVESAKVATPAWGGPVLGVLEVENDGKALKVNAPKFLGQGSEQYIPTDWAKIPVRAQLYFMWYDKLYKAERSDISGNKPFDVLPNGRLAPVAFEIKTSNEYKVVVEYKSGVLGAVKAEQRVNFIARQ